MSHTANANLFFIFYPNQPAHMSASASSYWQSMGALRTCAQVYYISVQCAPYDDMPAQPERQRVARRRPKGFSLLVGVIFSFHRGVVVVFVVFAYFFRATPIELFKLDSGVEKITQKGQAHHRHRHIYTINMHNIFGAWHALHY